MKPDEFLDTARDLIQIGRREGDWRTSISRSYYAIYGLLTGEILRTIPLLILQATSLCRGKNQIAHEQLPAVMMRSRDEDLKSIGTLERLRFERVAADYRFAKIITKQFAADMVIFAGELKSEIERIGLANLVAKIKSEITNP